MLLAAELPSEEELSSLFSATNSLQEIETVLNPLFVELFDNPRLHLEEDACRFVHSVLTNVVEKPIVRNRTMRENGAYAKYGMLSWIMDSKCIQTNVDDILYLARYLGRVRAESVIGKDTELILARQLDMALFNGVASTNCVSDKIMTLGPNQLAWRRKWRGITVYNDSIPVYRGLILRAFRKVVSVYLQQLSVHSVQEFKSAVVDAAGLSTNEVRQVFGE